MLNKISLWFYDRSQYKTLCFWLFIGNPFLPQLIIKTIGCRVHLIGKEVLVLECQVYEVGFFQVSWDQFITQPCEDCVTCECLEQSDIEAHSFQFYFQHG